MKCPSPTWEATYSHSRRAARHRCRCCRKVLNAGDAAVMARVSGGSTLAIHAGCAAAGFANSVWTWRDAMAAWGTDYLIGCGYKAARHPMASFRSIQAES